MSIRYIGHCAFLFEDRSGASLLIDPFGNESDDPWFLKSFPSLAVDLVAVTHNHSDHNGVETLPDGTAIMSEAGLRVIGDTEITGIRDLHRGTGETTNFIYVVTHEGVRYCHLGDNRLDIPGSTLDEIGRIDVLMIGIGGSGGVLDQGLVDALVGAIGPRIVIPMHYYVEGLTAPHTGLLHSDVWVKRQSPRRPLRQSTFRIDRRGLPYEREVWTVPPELAGR